MSGLSRTVPQMECKAEEGREGEKGAKPRLMTHMAKLFCLYRVLRHQHLQRINEEKRKIFPQLNPL